MSQQLAIMKKDIVDKVSNQVKEFESKGELSFPKNYNPQNAMKSAWLELQEVTNKNGAPVLESCTQDSVANSLLSMVVQGLTTQKKQGYFIAYGRQLAFQRSYFGTMAVTKRVTGAKDIVAQVVYENDEFDYEILPEGKKVLTHKQKLGNIKKDKIIGAYCTIVFGGEKYFTDVMSMDEIEQSWKMSRSKSGSTHKEFPADMCKKTVINRTCKMYINSSDDSSLITEHFHNQDEVIQEGQTEEEISENANAEFIDVEFEEVKEEAEPNDEFSNVEPEPETVPEQEKEPEEDEPDF